jgi:hypothetical protein
VFDATLSTANDISTGEANEFHIELLLPGLAGNLLLPFELLKRTTTDDKIESATLLIREKNGEGWTLFAKRAL